MFQQLAQLRQQNALSRAVPSSRPVQAPAPPPNVVQEAPAQEAQQRKRAPANPKLLPTGRMSNASLHPSKRVVNQTQSGFKKGVPTVSSHVAKLIDKYDTMDDLNNKITLYRHAKNYKRRGFTHSSMLNVIQPPGSLAGGVPTVGTKEEVSNATISNASQAVGYETPDMKTMFQAFMNAMNTSKQSVNPAVLDAGIPESAKEGGVVPNDNNTPAMPKIKQEFMTQAPDKINEKIQSNEPVAIKKSLFRR